MNTDAIVSMQQEGQLRDLIAQRSDLYGFLSRLFEKEVDDELLDHMCRMKLPRSTGNDDVDRAYAIFHEVLSNRWERTVEDLRIDYARAFFGNGVNGTDCAYPFESVHTSGDRLMMRDARDEVMALYRSEGFEKSEEWKDTEDHIALELAFEKVLCDKAVVALDAGDAEDALRLLIVQYNFLRDHLVNWVPMFVSGIEKFAATDFYRAVGYLTFGYLAEDREFLESVLSECDVEIEEDPHAEGCVEIDDVDFTLEDEDYDD